MEMNNIGVKHDQDKPKLNLLPPFAIMEVGKVLTYGAEKYSPENWRKIKDIPPRYTASALRHIFQYMQGEKEDEESGISHLAHAICSLMYIIEDDMMVHEGVVLNKTKE